MEDAFFLQKSSFLRRQKLRDNITEPEIFPWYNVKKK